VKKAGQTRPTLDLLDNGYYAKPAPDLGIVEDYRKLSGTATYLPDQCQDLPIRF
jgi:hypothetical protein